MQQNTAAHHKHSLPAQHKTVQLQSQKGSQPSDLDARAVRAGRELGTITAPFLIAWFVWWRVRIWRRRLRASMGYREVHVYHDAPQKG